MVKELTSDQFDRICDQMLATKTFKNLRQVEKDLKKQFGDAISSDALIHFAMAYGRESTLAQIAAHAKELDDARGNTLDKRIAKFRKRFKLHFYYHQVEAWWTAYISTAIIQVLISCPIGLFDNLSMTKLSYWYLVASQIFIDFSIATWFSHRMHTVIEEA